MNSGQASAIPDARQVNDPAWAWDVFSASGPEPWDERKIGHLYRRAGFGANWAEIERALVDGPQETVRRLTTPPPQLPEFHQQFDQFLHQAAQAQGPSGLRAWWLRRMLETPFPLEEKLILFWQDHFAVSSDRVRDGLVMADYLSQLRSHALGSWKELLTTVCQHPAIFLSAGVTAHRKAQPSLDWAKVFSAHLALGPGGETVTELEQIARAWTGWFVVNNRLRFVPSEHDPGPREILGRRGDLGIPEVVAIFSEHPASREYIARKLFRYFVSEEYTPSAELLAPLVDMLAAGASVLEVVRRILSSRIFFSPIAYRTKIKSPVELAIGVARIFEGTIPTTKLGDELAQLGQDPTNPPTFEGWADGRAWLHHGTYLRRKRLLCQLVLSPEMSGGMDPWSLADKYGWVAGDKFAQFLLKIVYQDDLPELAKDFVYQKWQALRQTKPFQPGQAAKSLLTDVLLLPEFELS